MMVLPNDERVKALEEAILGIAGSGRLMAAFSGGVDSCLLLLAAVETLGPSRVVAATVASPTTADDVEDAARFATHLGCRHLVLDAEEWLDPDFIMNSPERCYICKRIRYSALWRVARSEGCAAIVDGSQADDDPAQRPGFRALTELGVRVPLREAQLGKDAIRELLAAAGFAREADKATQACLATRIPTGVPITLSALDRVRRGESALLRLGLAPVRLRDHHPVARIALDEAGMGKLLAQPGLKEAVVQQIRAVGYEFVTMDLRPYR